MTHKIVTAAERPDLGEKMNDFTSTAWPEFMKQDPLTHKFWHRLYPDFSEYQIGLFDESEKVLAVGNSHPLRWEKPLEELPEAGWDWAFETAFADLDSGRKPTVLSALQIVTDPTLRGAGLSATMVSAMVAVAKKQGLKYLIAPVRPNQKCLYPLTPMENYIRWRRGDGLLFDPWMRVHERLGAEVIKVCPQAMHIPGTVTEWEKWTGMVFPESGEYVIPFALVPIKINCEKDLGEYIEPNVWMVHKAV